MVTQKSTFVERQGGSNLHEVKNTHMGEYVCSTQPPPCIHLRSPQTLQPIIVTRSLRLSNRTTSELVMTIEQHMNIQVMTSRPRSLQTSVITDSNTN